MQVCYRAYLHLDAAVFTQGHRIIKSEHVILQNFSRNSKFQWQTALEVKVLEGRHMHARSPRLIPRPIIQATYSPSCPGPAPGPSRPAQFKPQLPLTLWRLSPVFSAKSFECSRAGRVSWGWVGYLLSLVYIVHNTDSHSSAPSSLSIMLGGSVLMSHTNSHVAKRYVCIEDSVL